MNYVLKLFIFLLFTIRVYTVSYPAGVSVMHNVVSIRKMTAH